MDRRREVPSVRASEVYAMEKGPQHLTSDCEIGVPLSTLYRWRERDAKFRRRWDDILLQRRQIVEDRLMAIIREGELRSVSGPGLTSSSEPHLPASPTLRPSLRYSAWPSSAVFVFAGMANALETLRSLSFATPGRATTRLHRSHQGLFRKLGPTFNNFQRT